MRMPTPAPTLAALLLAAPLLLTSCGDDAKKPSAADIAAYLAQSEPSWLHVSGVSATYEKLERLGNAKAADGSWRVRVTFTLHATQDLYAAEEDAAALRLSFDKAVNSFTGYREPLIEQVNNAAYRVGLIRKGDATPEPAVPVVLKTHANQDIADGVSLLAQPEGSGWSFVQTDAQVVSDEEIGMPLDTLKASSPHTVYVVAGSEEDRSFRAREAQFLSALAQAAKKPQ